MKRINSDSSDSSDNNSEEKLALPTLTTWFSLHNLQHIARALYGSAGGSVAEMVEQRPLPEVVRCKLTLA